MRTHTNLKINRKNFILERRRCETKRKRTESESWCQPVSHILKNEINKEKGKDSFTLLFQDIYLCICICRRTYIDTFSSIRKRTTHICRLFLADCLASRAAPGSFHFSGKLPLSGRRQGFSSSFFGLGGNRWMVIFGAFLYTIKRKMEPHEIEIGSVKGTETTPRESKSEREREKENKREWKEN